MARRDDWNDETDHRPRRSSRLEGPGLAPWLIIGGLGLGLAAVVAVGVVILVLLWTNREELRNEGGPGAVAQLPNPDPRGGDTPVPVVVPKPAAPRNKGTATDNRARLIGTWRASAEQPSSPSNWLREFAVRPDGSATLNFHYPDGRDAAHEAQFEMIVQDRDSIRAIFRVPRGQYGYYFTFLDDDRIQIGEPRRPGKVFQRVK